MFRSLVLMYCTLVEHVTHFSLNDSLITLLVSCFTMNVCFTTQAERYTTHVEQVCIKVEDDRAHVERVCTHVEHVCTHVEDDRGRIREGSKKAEQVDSFFLFE